MISFWKKLQKGHPFSRALVCCEINYGCIISLLILISYIYSQCGVTEAPAKLDELPEVVAAGLVWVPTNIAK